MTNNGILLYAEVTKEGYLHTVLFELANKAQELSTKLNGESISALLISKPGLINEYKEAFEKSGFDKVFVIENEKFNNYSTELFAKAAVETIKEIQPSIMLIGATTQGRDLAPRISSSLCTGLTADCIDLDINEKVSLQLPSYFRRKTYGNHTLQNPSSNGNCKT